MARATRKQLSFDLDYTALKKYFHRQSEAYNKIATYMEANGFLHRQYSVYASKEPMTETAVQEFLDKLCNAFPWLAECTKGFDITVISKQYSLLQDIEHHCEKYSDLRKAQERPDYTPPKDTRMHKTTCTVHGQKYGSINEAANKYGIRYQVLNDFVHKGLSVEEAVDKILLQREYHTRNKSGVIRFDPENRPTVAEAAKMFNLNRNSLSNRMSIQHEDLETAINNMLAYKRAYGSHTVGNVKENMWTVEEENKLKKLYAQGWSAKEIAEMMPKRTEVAIQKKIRRLHLAAPEISDKDIDTDFNPETTRDLKNQVKIYKTAEEIPVNTTIKEIVYE